MYTVVIADRAMMGRLTDYRVLFEPFEKEGALDFCYWEPNCRDLDALPNLRSLIDNRLRWRALILLNPTAAGNPYDVPTGIPGPPSADGAQALSENPTVRLTQLLGGMRRYVTVEEDAPAPTADQDDPVVLTPFHFAPHTVPEPLHSQLRLPIRPPESIHLLAMRDMSQGEDWQAVQSSWKLQLEQNASAFWERCDYPESCRFMVFDVAEECDALLEADVFRWWMAVLTFTLNTVTPSSLQAYRLYRLNVTLEEDALREALQDMRARMLYLTGVLDQRRLRVRNENDNATESGLPPLDVAINLSFGGALSNCPEMDARQIGFSADRPNREEALWDQWEQQAYAYLTEALKQPRRALERASRDARENIALPGGPLPPYNDQVLEDLQEKMEKRESRIVSGQINPLLLGASVRDELSEDADRVRRALRTRFSHRALLGAVGVLAVSLLPYIGRFWVDNGLSQPRYLLMGLGFAALIALVVWLTLLALRSRLTGPVRAFRQHVAGVVQHIVASAKASGEYLSDVCSFMRGHALLDALRLSRRTNADEELPARRHRRRIETMLALCSDWSHRFSLPLDEHPAMRQNIDFDYDVPPAHNAVYRFSVNLRKDTIAIDHSGAMATAPYAFVSHLELTREEVYD